MRFVEERSEDVVDDESMDIFSHIDRRLPEVLNELIGTFCCLVGRLLTIDNFYEIIFISGLKKCIPTTSSGRSVALPIYVIDSDEVFEARIVSAGACLSMSAKTSCLRSIPSGTASVMRSASATLSARSTAISIRVVISSIGSSSAPLSSGFLTDHSMFWYQSLTISSSISRIVTP